MENIGGIDIEIYPNEIRKMWENIKKTIVKQWKYCCKNILFLYIIWKIGKAKLDLGNIEVRKTEFHKPKHPLV